MLMRCWRNVMSIRNTKQPFRTLEHVLSKTRCIFLCFLTPFLSFLWSNSPSLWTVQSSWQLLKTKEMNRNTLHGFSFVLLRTVLDTGTDLITNFFTLLIHCLSGWRPLCSIMWTVYFVRFLFLFFLVVLSSCSFSFFPRTAQKHEFTYLEHGLRDLSYSFWNQNQIFSSCRISNPK